MNENRRQILEMLAAGKITASEAEQLLAALEPDSTVSAHTYAHTVTGSNSNSAQDAAGKTHAKYLRVLVEADESMTGMKGPTTVNVRVPMKLLRAGVRLASLIPAQAHEQLDEALSRHGVPLTLSQIKPENLEELIDHLEDLTVDVDGKEGNTTKVRVFCE
jgi:DNA-binding transcriptional ArsR family regulator